ncbi:MAG: D-alanyl-D-alanine carboxypeptidase [Gammaproteobacteria bacterium]|nr:D-alanyl-D-alanine carboxypeptidase [Gammaproteobacteria bacterium]MBU2675530.1 D-alanyl-D-alanine carboxypeptidase [Gammaproteobacteria bacterium]NNC57275.1 D-alanyl-D-alanine carboxypeptidase [Woeseiaceae bacterium]NNL49265.1 D-alanyl-D-alanine carboxypeptidase [Woeseiaceae bacterium]
MFQRLTFAFASLVLFVSSAVPATGPMPTPAPPIIGAKSYLVIDSRTGRELASLNPDSALAPASLTKLMTTYVVFSALKQGQIDLEDEVTISEKAWRTEGSRMFIEVGTRVSIKDLLLGIIVQSGNDASVALAEHIAGTESVFAEMMNQYAATMGMHSSHFLNATGLPAEGHTTTARDLTTLARAMIAEFPDYYPWHSIKEFTYNNIKQSNRNSLLWRDASVDGLKTGHTDDAGYCLVASAKRDNMRVISVVLGTSSTKARTDGSQALLNYAFRFFETRLLFKAGEEVTTARVWKSANEDSRLGVLEDLYITVRRGAYDQLDSTLDIPAIVEAPVAAGQPLAELKVHLGEEELLSAPLLALDDNPTGSVWQRARDSVSLWFE